MNTLEKLWIKRESNALNRGLQIDVIPKIVNIFTRSNNTSFIKRRTHYLLRKQPNFREKNLDREKEDKEIKVREKQIIDIIKEIEQPIDVHQKREEQFLQHK